MTSRGWSVSSAAQSRNEERKPVRNGGDAAVCHQPAELLETQPPTARAGEHQRAFPERPRRVEDLHRPRVERDPVVALHLHPRGRDRPHVVRRVDLVLRRQPDLSRPRGDEHQELERQLDGRQVARPPHRRRRRGDLPVRQRLPVHDVALRAEDRPDPVGGLSFLRFMAMLHSSTARMR